MKTITIAQLQSNLLPTAICFVGCIMTPCLPAISAEDIEATTKPSAQDIQLMETLILFKLARIEFFTNVIVSVEKGNWRAAKSFVEKHLALQISDISTFTNAFPVLTGIVVTNTDFIAVRGAIGDRTPDPNREVGENSQSGRKLAALLRSADRKAESIASTNLEKPLTDNLLASIGLERKMSKWIDDANRERILEVTRSLLRSELSEIRILIDSFPLPTKDKITNGKVLNDAQDILERNQ